MLNNKKIEFHLFSVADYEEEQTYLRENHKKGLKLIKYIMPSMYIFEKCVPEDVIYQLDYSPEGRKNKLEYLQMFYDCGWEYLFDACGWSYFRKPASLAVEDEEIFSDQDSKLDLMNRIGKGRLIPLLILFFLVIIPQLFIQLHGISSSQIEDKPVHFGFLIVFSLCFFIYIMIFVNFGMKYLKLKKRS